MSQVYAIYWSDPKAMNQNGKKFRIQIHIPPKTKLSEIKKALDGWSMYGESISPKEKILICSRLFEDDSDFNRWKKSFPFTIGKTHPGEKPKKGTGRKCGICDEYGHNARTCQQNPANEGKPLAPKKDRDKQYKCGVCGELGHNARTCPKR